MPSPSRPAGARAAARRHPAPGRRRRRGGPPLGTPPAGLPGSERGNGPRRPRGDRAHARRPPIRRPWSTSACPILTATRHSSGSVKFSRTCPIILMTGFGWDPTHSIVKARQEGLQTVLYKPFRADRLMEAVEQALRSSPAGRTAAAAPAAAPGPARDSTRCDEQLRCPCRERAPSRRRSRRRRSSGRSRQEPAAEATPHE